jgi:hypothetical protein
MFATDPPPGGRTDRGVDLADGRQFGYADYGPSDGDPLVVVHGTPGSRYSVFPESTLLDEYGIGEMGLERPGFDRSTSDSDREILDWPADVREATAALDLKKFSLLGTFGGAPTCWSVRPRRPSDSRTWDSSPGSDRWMRRERPTAWRWSAGSDSRQYPCRSCCGRSSGCSSSRSGSPPATRISRRASGKAPGGHSTSTACRSGPGDSNWAVFPSTSISGTVNSTNRRRYRWRSTWRSNSRQAPFIRIPGGTRPVRRLPRGGPLDTLRPVTHPASVFSTPSVSLL